MAVAEPLPWVVQQSRQRKQERLYYTFRKGRKGCATAPPRTEADKTLKTKNFWVTNTQIIQRLSHAHTHIYTLKRLYSTWVAWQRWQGAYQLEPGESNGTRVRKWQDERKKKGRERVSSRKWETLCDRQRGCVWKKRENLELPTTALKGESSLMHTTDKMKPWQQRVQIHLV